MVAHYAAAVAAEQGAVATYLGHAGSRGYRTPTRRHERRTARLSAGCRGDQRTAAPVSAFRAVSATALPYVKHSFWAGHDGHRCHDPPGLSSMLIETSRSLPPLGTPRAVGRFASRQEHPPERMAPQLFVLPRTAPVPPVLPGEPAYHAQPCRLALPPAFRIARPPRIVCPQPCISLPLARHPHIRLLTGDHARRMVPVKLPRLGSAPSAALPLVLRPAASVPQPQLVR